MLWNVPGIHGYPFTGSAIYYWDIGPVRENPPAPANHRDRTAAVREPAEPPGEDPHGAPRAAAAEQQLVSDFFNGAIQKSDNCDNKAVLRG